MNNSQRQLRLLNLVRKLLKLGRSNSNAHEAGLALQRAQKLMARYGISELDAGLISVREASSRTAPSDAEKVPEWMVALVRGVCHAFGCRAYYSWRQTSAGYRRSVTFYGFSEKPEIAAYAFDVLTRQLKDATTSYLKTQSKRLKLTTRRARAEQFRDGWVCGVRELITGIMKLRPSCQSPGGRYMRLLKKRAPGSGRAGCPLSSTVTRKSVALIPRQRGRWDSFVSSRAGLRYWR